MKQELIGLITLKGSIFSFFLRPTHQLRFLSPQFQLRPLFECRELSPDDKIWLQLIRFFKTISNAELFLLEILFPLAFGQHSPTFSYLHMLICFFTHSSSPFRFPLYSDDAQIVTSKTKFYLKSSL